MSNEKITQTNQGITLERRDYRNGHRYTEGNDMTTHQIGDRFTHGRTGTGTKYDIILGSDGYALQEVATGRNPLWWDAQNFIGGFDTLEQAITAVELIDDANDVSWSRQDLFDLKGI